MSRKANAFLGIIIIINIIMFSGCNTNKSIDTSKPIEANKLDDISKIASSPSQTFLNAIEKLDHELSKDSRIRDSLLNQNPSINQLILNNTYEIAWSNDIGVTSILVVYSKSSTLVPIYLMQPGKRIESLRQIDLGLDQVFFEVISSGNSMSHYNQKVNLLQISGDKATEKWEYEIISSDIDKNIINTVHSSYLYIPTTTLESSVCNDSFPKILVTDLIESATIKENIKSITSERTINKLFSWDNTQIKFIEQVIK